MPLLFEQIQQNVSAKARFSLGSYRMRPLKHVKVVNNSGCVGMPEKWRRLESHRCSGWKPPPLWVATFREGHTQSNRGNRGEQSMLNARRTRDRQSVIARRIAPKQSRDIKDWVGATPE